MPAKVKKMKGDNKQIFFRTAYSRFYHCAKTSTFHISKSSTIILSSLKPLWKSEGSGFGWTCPGLMGLNLSSSYWLLSILVKPKPSCIPRAFRGAQLTSSCHRGASASCSRGIAEHRTRRAGHLCCLVGSVVLFGCGLNKRVVRYLPFVMKMNFKFPSYPKPFYDLFFYQPKVCSWYDKELLFFHTES